MLLRMFQMLELKLPYFLITGVVCCLEILSNTTLNAEETKRNQFQLHKVAIVFYNQQQQKKQRIFFFTELSTAGYGLSSSASRSKINGTVKRGGTIVIAPDPVSEFTDCVYVQEQKLTFFP